MGQIERLLARRHEKEQMPEWLKSSLERAERTVASWPESKKAAMRVGKYADPEVEAAYARGELKEETMPAEEVHHPAHFGGGDNPYETIEVLRATMTPEEFKGFIKGNVIKYTMRAGKKAGVPEKKDMQKAEWYLAYWNNMPAETPEEAGRRKLTVEQAQQLARQARERSVQRREEAAEEEARRQGDLLE
jgi:hypothetical protein